MPSTRNDRTPFHAEGFDLTELRPLYGPAEFRTLISRALAQLECLQREFDSHLAVGENVKAAHVLHLMAGTASFFCGDPCALDALHHAQSALKSSDRAFVPAALPQARRVLGALARRLAAELASLETG
ncbi:MAG: hypothetical protein QOH33_127 [Paraburkholderia sp.]|nr:hypothetical protein [Paraburkholderia sp.]